MRLTQDDDRADRVPSVSKCVRRARVGKEKDGEWARERSLVRLRALRREHPLERKKRP